MAVGPTPFTFLTHQGETTATTLGMSTMPCGVEWGGGIPQAIWLAKQGHTGILTAESLLVKVKVTGYPLYSHTHPHTLPLTHPLTHPLRGWQAYTLHKPAALHSSSS